MDKYSATEAAYKNGYKQGKQDAVVHARWENVQNGKGCCSNCHRLDSIDNLATYCRYCGAKLERMGQKVHGGEDA